MKIETVSHKKEIEKINKSDLPPVPLPPQKVGNPIVKQNTQANPFESKLKITVHTKKMPETESKNEKSKK